LSSIDTLNGVQVALRPDDDDLPLMFDRAESDLSIRKKLLVCTADERSCPVHNRALLAKPMWMFVSTPQQLEELLDACNVRGFRESDLADNLRFCKQRLTSIVEQSAKSVAADGGWLVANKSPIGNTAINWPNEVREILLELEEKARFLFISRFSTSFLFRFMLAALAV
jgi:hypothetical protein